MIKKEGLIRAILWFIGALLAYTLIPRLATPYIMTVLNSVLIFYIACLGIAVILGMGGMVSFAAIVFVGVGAYSSALLTMRLHFPVLLALLGAMVTAGVISFLIGMVLLKLKGTFFTFSTVALVQIGYSIFMNWRKVTGGPDGIAGVPIFTIGSFQARTAVQCFYILLSACFLAAMFVARLRKTNLGRALSSVRDNEIAAQIMGVNVYRTKVIAFTIAGILAGLSGGLMAHTYHFVGATSFVFDQSTTFVIMVMLGGVSSTPGVFLGTLIITMLPEWLKPLQEYIRLFYGLGVILLMVFMPMGLAGMFASVTKQIQYKFKLGHRTIVGLNAERVS
jgi:branched-chain amino acid transport system permease protein